MSKTPLFLICLLALACSSPAPPTTYLFRAGASPRPGTVDVPLRYGLGSVVVAPYLQQPGIVVETGAGQVHPAGAHEWAEPLGAGVRAVLRADLSAALGEEVSADQTTRPDWAYAVDVSIDRLHGTMQGNAVIDASFRITRRGAEGGPVESRFSQSILIPQEGYEGMIEAEVKLVGALADAIATRLRGLPPVAGESP